MDAQRAYEIAQAASRIDPGSFYGKSDNLAVGAGLIIDRVEFPIFDEEAGRFAVKAGLVYVVSHECDLDPANERLMNELAIVCPIMKMEDFVDAATALDEGFVVGFLGNLAARNVSRAVYLPPMGGPLPFGGMLYLNAMSHTHVSKLANDETVNLGCVTARGLLEIDMALERHLRRPKSDLLPLSYN